jgi:serine/threonine protein kinase
MSSPEAEDDIERLPLLPDLRRAYQSGDLVLLAGAGVSMAARLPSWKALIVELGKVAAQQPGVGQELASDQEEVERCLERQQYVAAMSILARRLGPTLFHQHVQRLLDCEPLSVPEVAEAIASLAPQLRYVLTTNLDRLLERALGWEGVVASDGDFAHHSRIVLKLHGTRLRPQTWVMTGDDYDRVMHDDASTRQNIEAILRTRTVLFVGFGLVDDHFDLLFSRLRARGRQSPPPSFALIPAAETPDPQRIRELAKAGLQLLPYPRHEDVPRILRAIAHEPGHSPKSAPHRIVASRYALLERLGAGRTATVYKARDLLTQDLVAIRMLHPHLAQEAAERDRFVAAHQLMRAKAGALAGMVSVHSDVLEDDGTLLYATTHVDGVDLRRRVLDGKLSHDEICEIVRGVARCLRSLHQHQLIHGGIAPNKIVIDQAKHPWLTEIVVPRAPGTALSPYASPSPSPDAEPRPSVDVFGLAMTMVFGLHGQDLSHDVLRDIDGFLERLECSVELRDLLGQTLRTPNDVTDVDAFLEPLSRAQWSTADINRINVRRAIERNLFNASAPNVRLGKFELISRIGGGSFSEVHRARDTLLDRDVAIKMLTSVRASDARDLRERIQREARALTRVRHPHVVEIYDHDPHGSHPFIVLRFVDGMPLAKWMLDHSLGWQDIVAAMRGVALGLQAMHDVDLVHRDLKPANIIVEPTPTLRACVVDFGLAHPPGPPTDGTPAYMAPEQAQGRAEPRSDQFSFCASLFHALYGRRPFPGSSRDEILARVEREVPVPSENPRGVPTGILRVLQRGLSPEPGDRHPTMTDLVAALDAELRAAITEPTLLLWESMRSVFSRP